MGNPLGRPIAEYTNVSLSASLALTKNAKICEALTILSPIGSITGALVSFVCSSSLPSSSFSGTLFADDNDEEND